MLLFIQFFFIIFCFSLSPVSCIRRNAVEDLHLVYYKGKNLKNSITYTPENFTDILKLSSFKLKAPTTLYIHGYEESIHSPSIYMVVRAYLRFRPEINIIAMDWSNMGSGPYITKAIPNTELVGRAVGNLLLQLIAKGVQENLFHIVGLSLGCHVAGLIGKSTRASGVTLARITGLDCAGPFFFPSINSRRISTDDAAFVDTIHTDSGRLGYPFTDGLATFWPNGGFAVQRGCGVSNYLKSITIGDIFNGLCSHSRSVQYYTETVYNPKAFYAVECSNYENFKKNKCSRNSKTYMGFGASTDARGNFYLITNPKSPFGMGKDGIKYVNETAE